MSEDAEKELSFEEAMERLEGTIRVMEEGNAPLDEMIRQFEEARKLSKYCQQKLTSLKQKIDLLIKDSASGQQWQELPPPAPKTEL